MLNSTGKVIPKKKRIEIIVHDSIWNSFAFA